MQAVCSRHPARMTGDGMALRKRLAVPHDRRMWAVFEALDRTGRSKTFTTRRGSIRGSCSSSRKSRSCAAPSNRPAADGLRGDQWLTLKRAGFGDLELSGLLGVPEAVVREKRQPFAAAPAYKRIDTCAAEFESFTPYMYGSYEPFCESEPNARKKVVILGSGPNRIGQGIEFDYCCCHAAFALREEGFETVMINCNPETVSTDYDTTDRLYFEPLTFEDVMAVLDKERVRRRRRRRASCSSADRRRSSLRCRCRQPGVTIIGTSPDSIDLAEDRRRFSELLSELTSLSPRAAPPPRAKKRGMSRMRSDSRWSCDRRTCSAGAAWRSSMTAARSIGT